MATDGRRNLDVVIFGGGAAGLWLLDRLHRAGYAALLLEPHELGSGSDIASQGFISARCQNWPKEAGLPSSGTLSFPTIWRRCLAGEPPRGLPNLKSTRLRAPFSVLWRTPSLRSTVGMWRCMRGLALPSRLLPADERPTVLANFTPTVLRVEEQLIEPVSLLEDFANQHRTRILHIDAQSGLEFVQRDDGTVNMVRLINPSTGDPLDLDINPEGHVIHFSAWHHERLCEMMFVRPLRSETHPVHQVLLRGNLPMLNGRCITGVADRLTVTSTRDCLDRAVWQIHSTRCSPGNDRATALERVRAHLREALPDLDLRGAEWSTYAITPERRDAWPPSISERSNILIMRQTTLVHAPSLAEYVMQRLRSPLNKNTREYVEPLHWPRPCVALPPWEQESRWEPEP
ncbi:MAG TPA: hypothetical protein PK400_00200 [Phycisphaerales bacterium]|nr:hypothetical protein [Phycisphaerales bacterium]HRQ75164.1 hypothetical protein [Phycisphaerales bacterium]